MASTVLLTAGSLFVGCNNDDAYNSNYASELYQTGFETTFGTIDTSQDWKMVTSRAANISVNTGTSESYTVGVYQNNPLNDVSNCGLLAQGTVSDGNSVNLTFDSPTAQTYYYVGLFDSKGRSIVKLDSAINNTVTVDFGASDASAAKVQTRSISSSSYSQTWSDRAGSLNLGTMRQTYYDLTKVPTEDLQVMSDVNTNNGKEHGKFYIVPSGKTFTGSFALQGTQGTVDSSVLLVDGTLDLSGTNNLTLNSVTLVVSSTGKVIVNKDVTMSNTSRILVEAGGAITLNGTYTFKIANGGKSYSAGTITGTSGTFDLNGVDLYNCGSINVKNLINSTSGGQFTNFGSIKAVSNEGANNGAYNMTYINECYMSFSEYCGVGNITLLDNSRVDAPGKLFITGTVKLGNKAEINAGTTQLQSATFNGPTESGEFAVMKTAKMLVSYEGDLNVSGNTYFDWDIANECYKYDGTTKWDVRDQYNASYRINKKIGNWSTESSSALTIPSGDCTGTGYNSDGDGGDIPTNPSVYTIAYEDLGSIGDYDFNDVVLYVYPNKNTNTLKVDLVAAGGTLTTDAYYGSTKMFSHDNGTMENTSSDTNDKTKVLATYSTTLPSGFTLTDDNFISLFRIVVHNENGTETSVAASTATGKAPQALLIPTNWTWPKETVNIGTKYTNFKKWIADKTQSINWYE